MENSEKKRDPFRIAPEGDLNEGLTRLTIDKTEMVLVKHRGSVSVFGGECLHEGALLANGFIEGDYLTCGKHLWRYHLETGELDGEAGFGLKKLSVWTEEGDLCIDLNEVAKI